MWRGGDQNKCIQQQDTFTEHLLFNKHCVRPWDPMGNKIKWLPWYKRQMLVKWLHGSACNHRFEWVNEKELRIAHGHRLCSRLERLPWGLPLEWKPESKCFPLKEGGQCHNPDAEGTWELWDCRTTFLWARIPMRKCAKALMKWCSSTRCMAPMLIGGTRAFKGQGVKGSHTLFFVWVTHTKQDYMQIPGSPQAWKAGVLDGLALCFMTSMILSLFLFLAPP